MIIKGKVKNLWAEYNGMLLPVHTDAKEQVAEIEIELTGPDLQRIVRNHFSTVLQKEDIMVAIIQSGNNAAQDITDRLEHAK